MTIIEVATNVKFIVDTGKEDDLVDLYQNTILADWKDEKLFGLISTSMYKSFF